MLLLNEREKIVEFGKKLIRANLTKGTGGNLSIYDRERELIVITPSSKAYEMLEPKDILVLNIKGEIIDGDGIPSSEFQLHRIFYENRQDINAIVHSHSPYATTLACLNWSLPAVHYMVALAGVDVRCAKYATYGTKELALNAYEAMADRKAVLLANHGLIAGDINIEKAFNIAEEIEYCSELYYRAKSIGDPIILNREEMVKMVDRFRNYSQVNNV